MLLHAAQLFKLDQDKKLVAKKVDVGATPTQSNYIYTSLPEGIDKFLLTVLAANKYQLTVRSINQVGEDAFMTAYDSQPASGAQFKWNVKKYHMDKDNWFTIQSAASKYFLTAPKLKNPPAPGNYWVNNEIPGTI